MGQERLSNIVHDVVSMLPPPDLRHVSQSMAPALLDSRLVGNQKDNHHLTTTNNDTTTISHDTTENNVDNANLDASNRDLTSVSPTAPISAGLEAQPPRQLQDYQYFARQMDGLQQMLALQQQQQQSLHRNGQSTGITNGNGGSPAIKNPSGSGGGGGGIHNGNASGPLSSPLLPLIGTSTENPLLSVLVDTSTYGNAAGGTATSPQINNNNNNMASCNEMNSNRHPSYQHYHVQHLHSHLNSPTQQLQQQQQGSPAVPTLLQADTPTASPAQINGVLGPTPNTAAANVLSTMQHYAQQQQSGGNDGGLNMSGIDPGSLMQINGGDGFGMFPQAQAHAPAAATASAPRRRRGRGGGSAQPAIPRAPRPRPEGTVAPPRSSKYRGVTKHRRSGRYEAHIWVKDLGRQVYLGGYECEEHAAEAYDIAALKSKGSRTKINFELSKYTDLLGCIDRMTMEELVMAVRRQSQGFSRGTSTYRGVTHHPSGRWEARIGIPGSKHVYLGLYMEEKEAAQAYDRALVRLRGGTAATNFSLAEYRLEMGDYHRMQSRLLRNDPLFTDISADAVLYERWIKNGTEGFPEVESPEMEEAMEQIAAVLTNGARNAVNGDDVNNSNSIINTAAAAGAVVPPTAGAAADASANAPTGPVRGANRTVTKAHLNRVHSTAERQEEDVSGAVVDVAAAGAGDYSREEEEALTQDLTMPDQPPQRQIRNHGPAMIALQAKLAGEMQPGDQKQQTVENDAMQQDKVDF